ncbi:MAG TPA: hypothetical protein VGU68_06945 [Ktedonobacteraceae bacterium]|nr:hypothetical protein [Ktedonobacteraceae bacterium]
MYFQLNVDIADLTSYFGGHAAPVNYVGRHWLPGHANFTFYSTVILALLCIKVSLNMGVEINEGCSITRHLLLGSIVLGL